MIYNVAVAVLQAVTWLVLATCLWLILIRLCGDAPKPVRPQSRPAPTLDERRLFRARLTPIQPSDCMTPEAKAMAWLASNGFVVTYLTGSSNGRKVFKVSGRRYDRRGLMRIAAEAGFN